MEKPINIKINEFRENLCKIINESDLSSYVLINELEAAIYSLVTKEKQLEQQYNEALKGSEEKCKK